MADYFVASGGSNTAPYETWAKAATSLATALAAAATAGDRVIIQYNAVPSGDAELAADTTYTPAANIQIISASNDGGSAFTPTAMGTANWIGNSTTNRGIIIAGSDRISLWSGVTLRTAGASADDLSLSSSATIGQQTRYEGCYFWLGGTNTSSRLNVTADRAYVECHDCTFRLGSTPQRIVFDGGKAVLTNCTLSSAGSTPTTAFAGSTFDASVTMIGCDLSIVTGTLIADCAQVLEFVFDRCKLGAAVTVLASQTSNPTRVSGSALILDCASGDTQVFFGYYNALGSVVSDTGIYFTAGDAAQSWKIVTTANARFGAPFVTPPIARYNSTLSSITPYLEILRDGSTTAYQDDEVWARFQAKTTSGFTTASTYTDRMTVAGTPANLSAGAGLGSWTGESGTAWSGKIESGSAFTPAEVGDITVTIQVGEPSITVYVDPQIRT
jgi:hypothetical protein